MLDIYEEFEKRNNKNSYESEVNDLLSWLWENIDESKLNCDELVYHDNFNNYIESEKIDCDEIIEKIVNGKNKIVKETMFYNETAAQNFIMELLENAYKAGVEAAENELNQRINEYNENLDRIKQEIKKFSVTTEPKTADLMQNLYKEHKEMNLFVKSAAYYVIEKFDTYHKTSFYLSTVYHDKKEAMKEARKQNKNTGKYNNGTPYSIYRVYHVKDGIYTEVKAKIKQKLIVA